MTRFFQLYFFKIDFFCHKEQGDQVDCIALCVARKSVFAEPFISIPSVLWRIVLATLAQILINCRY